MDLVDSRDFRKLEKAGMAGPVETVDVVATAEAEQAGPLTVFSAFHRL